MTQSHVLYLITNGQTNALGEPLPAWLSLLEADAPFALQLREKHLSAKALLSLGQRMKAYDHSGRHPLLVNDRLDVALALQAAGVHLAHHSIGIAETRRILPPHMAVGLSVHSLDEALRAEQAGANYILFGHIYPSASKPGLAPRGIQQLQTVVDRVAFPVIALGGIDVDRVDDVLATGCSGLAVISAVFNAPNPRAAAEVLADRLARYPHPPNVSLDLKPKEVSQ